MAPRVYFQISLVYLLQVFPSNIVIQLHVASLVCRLSNTFIFTVVLRTKIVKVNCFLYEEISIVPDSCDILVDQRVVGDEYFVRTANKQTILRNQFTQSWLLLIFKKAMFHSL